MAKLTPVFLDYETFWDTHHSLSKMNPIAYVMHPATDIISVAIKVGFSGETKVYLGEQESIDAIKAIDWSDKIAVAHNMSGFDAMILAWRCGVRPAMWGCTLAMAKPHHAKTTGVSLAKLVEYYGVGVKNAAVLNKTKGRRLADFSDEEKADMMKYNGEDTDQCAMLFQKLLPVTSNKEMKLIDLTIKMLVYPEIEVDERLLVDTLADERRRKLKMLVELANMLGVDTPAEVEKTLASAPQFKKLLESLGVECPMKPSPANPEKLTPALAKTDEDMLALQEHDNPVVAAAASARLGVKSTILETRIEAFLSASRATGLGLPMPLVYYGGHTGRWCLAEGSPVLVRDMNGVVFELPIEKVSHYYEVWDGGNWVNHMGVEYSGDKDVITWDGVTATPEHIVWVGENEKVMLQYALDNELPIWRGNDVPDIQANIPVREVLYRLDEADS